jgi:hypothetical protein
LASVLCPITPKVFPSFDFDCVQGYLSVNRLGPAIQFAHAGLTAEGDNRVLMQKVTKEVMALAQQGKHRIPKVHQREILTIQFTCHELV